MTEEPKTNFRELLARTPEEIKADDDEQTVNRARLSGSLPNSVEKATYLHALGCERDARANIDSLLETMRAEKGASDLLSGALKMYRAKLAESLFLQGRFGDAVAMETREDSANFYQSFQAAFENLDAPVCQCAGIATANGVSAKGAVIPSRRAIEVIYVGAMSRSVSFIKCEKCGEIFAVSN